MAQVVVVSQLSLDRVELKRVSKVFGNVVALRNISLTVRAGETVVLAGHNGAGKSTLLSVLATLIRPTSGEVLFDGQPAAALGAELRATIGFAAEQPLGYAELTGRENVVFQAKAHRLSRPTERADEVIEALGLAALADRSAGGYSQGELRRLALARALVHSPRMLLLDEPTSGLDVMGATTLVELIRARGTEDAVSLISTHDPWLGAQIGQRVVTLARGEVSRDRSAPDGVEAWRELLGNHP